MNLIKRHKGLVLVGTLTLILLAILFIICGRMFFSTGETEYGKRLNGLVKLDKNTTKEIISEISEIEEVEKITIRTQGKIIYTTIIFKEGTKVAKAKEIASNTMNKYSEEVVGYYDFGFFLKENVIVDEEDKDEENVKTGFLVAGTKHPDIENISWTKN